MRRRPTEATNPEAPAFRFAWCISFFVTIAVVAILGLARTAQAATLPAPSLAAPVLAAPADDEFEEEAEASEGDEGFFEFDECEEAEECEEGEEEGDPEAPAECLLSSAEATVFATANRDLVRLQVRYRTTSPTAVAVDYGLHGAKGSLYLGGEKKRFGRTGVLRLSEDLTEAQMEKVMAAKGFTVRLRVAAAPRYCQSLFDRQLNLRQATPTGLAWHQSS